MLQWLSWLFGAGKILDIIPSGNSRTCSLTLSLRHKLGCNSNICPVILDKKKQPCGGGIRNVLWRCVRFEGDLFPCSLRRLRQVRPSFFLCLIVDGDGTVNLGRDGRPAPSVGLFHGLYGGGTRGTIPRLPLGPGERCVEIVQA